VLHTTHLTLSDCSCSHTKYSLLCAKLFNMMQNTMSRKLPFMDAPTQIDLHSMLEELELEDLISSCDNVSEHFR
jgi:hypothetical protein